MPTECDVCRGTDHPDAEYVTACRGCWDRLTGVASSHYIARLTAEAAERDGVHRGIQTAIRWVRSIPRRELVDGRVRIGADAYQRVASSIARHLQEREEAAEDITHPSLPPSSE